MLQPLGEIYGCGSLIFGKLHEVLKNPFILSTAVFAAVTIFEIISINTPMAFPILSRTVPIVSPTFTQSTEEAHFTNASVIFATIGIKAVAIWFFAVSMVFFNNCIESSMLPKLSRVSPLKT